MVFQDIQELHNYTKIWRVKIQVNTSNFLLCFGLGLRLSFDFIKLLCSIHTAHFVAFRKKAHKVIRLKPLLF